MAALIAIQRLLIANRGEIALRVIHACRELGIQTVAVFSDADAGAAHVLAADRAEHLGPSEPAKSYLNVEALLAAAARSGADAVHPGYGFLSENAGFARRVAAAGLTFVGPPADVIERMGDKAHARATARELGLTPVPGDSEVDGKLDFHATAARIGYPVLLKAAAGGGGRGMRRVLQPSEMDEALASARSEARAAFGQDALIIEKFIQQGRHIEVQILADAHGRTLAVLDRDCSVQRRHQKLCEECPAPGLDEALRRRLHEQARRLAAGVGYQSAGTVEFLVTPRGENFFLEMNTRIQVEHTVTELVTGLDLVQAQLAIARGEGLTGFSQDLAGRGHAIQVRLYAEDPYQGFLPSTGCVEVCELAAPPGVRLDSALRPGDEISSFYDALLAKISALATDRPTAIRRLLTALRASRVIGPTTNQAFLIGLLEHPHFRLGAVPTEFLQTTGRDLLTPPPPTPAHWAALALAADAPPATGAPSGSEGRVDAALPWAGPWEALDGWRSGAGARS